MHKEEDVKRQALHEKQESKKAKNIWKRTTDEDLRKIGKNWSQIIGIARDKQKWRRFVGVKC